MLAYINLTNGRLTLKCCRPYGLVASVNVIMIMSHLGLLLMLMEVNYIYQA